MVTSSDPVRPSTRWERFADRIFDWAELVAGVGAVLAVLCGLYAVNALLLSVDQGSAHEARLIRVVSSAPIIVNPQPGTTYVPQDGVVAEGQLSNGLIVQQPISLQERDAGHFTVYTRTTGHQLEVGANPLPNQWHHWRLGLMALVGALVLGFGSYWLARAAGIWI